MSQSIETTNGDNVTVSIKTNGSVQTTEVSTGSSTPVETSPEAAAADTFDNEVAIRPNAADEVPDLLKKVTSLGGAYANITDENTRAEFLDTARSLVYALETPREAMIRYCWSQSTLYAAIETCVDLGVFPVLSKDDTPKTATELAEATNADPAMLARLLKHLGAMGVIKETGPDTYRRNGFSTSLSAKRYSDAYPCMTGCITFGLTSLPAHLKNTSYRNPSDGRHAAFQDGYRTASHFFEYLQSHPAHAEQFNNHMTAYHQGRPSWMDPGFYPVASLTQGVGPTGTIGDEDVLLVDVGGGVGHDLSEFRRKWPDLPGRLVLQDLGEVIEQARAMNRATDAGAQGGIEAVVHDFFTEQPVKGARAYYMHSVLHDWTDADCRRILSNLVPALQRGYSKILINENVIPSTNAYWETTSLDIIMMADFASQERTEKQWHALVESVGLKVVKIWTVRRGVESLIECELA
ncbi:S-adenosyl-L-methionine-dependent methyltransferase [Aspergillus pseudoustus]|uniref:S-adenosyl-L-methionine-dependent methyltransferase n=1 Tax=Aspergillus pseudoustus TaxID=1810923 RepID=A0ABR4IHP6_9EURO